MLRKRTQDPLFEELCVGFHFSFSGFKTISGLMHIMLLSMCVCVCVCMCVSVRARARVCVCCQKFTKYCKESLPKHSQMQKIVFRRWLNSHQGFALDPQGVLAPPLDTSPNWSPQHNKVWIRSWSCRPTCTYLKCNQVLEPKRLGHLKCNQVLEPKRLGHLKCNQVLEQKRLQGFH